MTLTQEQKQAVERGEPVSVRLDETECVLLRKDVYERVASLLLEDWSHDELRALLARSAEANGWNEPAMDDYDRYDEVRRCR